MKMCSNFNRNVVQKKSAFNSIEEDIERSIKRLFIEDKNISNELKSLLVIPHKNCLTEIKNYENIINKYSLSKLMQDDFIRISPKMIYDFNAENQAGINVSVDLATPTSNEEYLQYSLSFFCMCNIDVWELEDRKSVV